MVKDCGQSKQERMRQKLGNSDTPTPALIHHLWKFHFSTADARKFIFIIL